MRRKRSPAKMKLRYRGRLKRPGTGAALKARWDDPEKRAEMLLKLKEGRERALAEGRILGRDGVPDGMRKREATKLNTQALESAKQTMADLEKAGVLDDTDAMGKEALQESLRIMRAPGDKRLKLSAARQVLEWTKAKPATKSDITVNKAEEWLAAIASADDKRETPTDAEASEG